MSNKITYITVCFLFLSSAVFISCNKTDYIKGGTISNSKVDATTYDYLASNALAQFDTLLLLVDKAGMKDVINEPGITFFAPNDNSIYNYLNARTIAAQKIDPNAKYTLDSLFKYDINRIKDSLKMYIVNQALTYDKLTSKGTKYPSALAGDTVVVSFEYTTDENQGYSPAVSSVPQITYFTQLWKHLDDPFEAGDIPNTIGVHTLCKTSGIQTTTGVLNTLESSHTLFFYGTKK
ncbi:MAG: fasciclin domain-containing protein [Flavisolibacter sp.]